MIAFGRAAKCSHQKLMHFRLLNHSTMHTMLILFLNAEEEQENHMKIFIFWSHWILILCLTNEFSLKLLFELDKLWTGCSSTSPSSLSIEYPERCNIICGCVNGFVFGCCCGVWGWANFGCVCCVLWKTNNKKVKNVQGNAK